MIKLNSLLKSALPMLIICNLVFPPLPSRADIARPGKPKANSMIRPDADAFPNPAVDKTTIYYLAKESGLLRVELYSSTGTLLTDIFEDQVRKGESYQFELDASTLNPGTYFFTIENGPVLIHRKLEIERR